MYDSKPKEREGEPLELVVPEAIDTTASREGDHGILKQGSLPEWLPEGKGAFAAVAAVALLEALVILVMLAV